MNIYIGVVITDEHEYWKGMNFGNRVTTEFFDDIGSAGVWAEKENSNWHEVHVFAIPLSRVLKAWFLKRRDEIDGRSLIRSALEFRVLHLPRPTSEPTP